MDAQPSKHIHLTAVGKFPPCALVASQVQATAHQGLIVTDLGGRPAQIAILDEAGNVLDVGPDVAQALWAATIIAYRNLLIGEGHIKVLAKPASPMQHTVAKAA